MKTCLYTINSFRCFDTPYIFVLRCSSPPSLSLSPGHYRNTPIKHSGLFLEPFYALQVNKTAVQYIFFLHSDLCMCFDAPCIHLHSRMNSTLSLPWTLQEHTYQTFRLVSWTILCCAGQQNSCTVFFFNSQISVGVLIPHVSSFSGEAHPLPVSSGYYRNMYPSHIQACVMNPFYTK